MLRASLQSQNCSIRRRAPHYPKIIFCWSSLGPNRQHILFAPPSAAAAAAPTTTTRRQLSSTASPAVGATQHQQHDPQQQLSPLRRRFVVGRPRLVVSAAPNDLYSNNATSSTNAAASRFGGGGLPRAQPQTMLRPQQQPQQQSQQAPSLYPQSRQAPSVQQQQQQQQESKDAANRKMMEFFKPSPTPIIKPAATVVANSNNNNKNYNHYNGMNGPNLQQQQQRLDLNGSRRQQPPSSSSSSFPQQQQQQQTSYANHRQQDSSVPRTNEPSSFSSFSWRGNQQHGNHVRTPPPTAATTQAAASTNTAATATSRTLSLNGVSKQPLPSNTMAPPQQQQQPWQSLHALGPQQQQHEPLQHHGTTPTTFSSSSSSSQPDLVDTMRKSFSLPPSSSSGSYGDSSNNSIRFTNASTSYSSSGGPPLLSSGQSPPPPPSPPSPSPLGSWRGHENGGASSSSSSSSTLFRTTDPSDTSKLEDSLLRRPSSIRPRQQPSHGSDSWQQQQEQGRRSLDINTYGGIGGHPTTPPAGGSMFALQQSLKFVIAGLNNKISPSNKAATTKDSPLFSTTSENLQSPLAGKILAMQLKNAQRKAERSSNGNNNNNSSRNDAYSQTWRKNLSPLQNARRESAASRQQQIQSQHAMNHATRVDTDALEYRILGTDPANGSYYRRRRPRVGGGRGGFLSPLARSGKSVRVLQHDYTLTDVSLLLRVSTRQLRRQLRMIGEGDRLHPQQNSKKKNPKQEDSNNTGSINSAERSRVVADEDIILEPDIVELVAMELRVAVERVEETRQNDEQILLQRRALAEAAASAASTTGDAYSEYPPRPPVVCIMGHVDHGKTTLMDTLRRRAQNAMLGDGKGASEKKKKKNKHEKGKKSKDTVNGNVAGTEAGGITQVISAFQVPLQTNEDETDDVDAVTFLDTPGHAAFKAMRQSGSDAADIIVLVVAADDGVSPQTIEIINFYKSIVKSSGDGGISMVVAMNKIDKPGINVEQAQMKIEGQLLEHGIMTEGMRVSGSISDEFGQPVQLIPVSGLTGEGLDDLIDGLVIQSEIMDLRADDKDKAEGVVLDARVERGLGIVVDCIIRWGSIRKGSVVVCGTCCGKVRILKDVNNKVIEEGLPSQPVRIVGFEDFPKAGDPIVCVETEEEAEELVAKRRAAIAATDGPTPVDSQGGQAELQSSGKHLMNYMWRERLEDKHGIEDGDENAPIRIPVIIRADADGTLAAVREAVIEIGKSSKHNVFIDPIHEGVGPTLATDIEMAKLSDASIICFNVKNEAAINTLAEEEGVPLLRNNVIYALLDEARETLGRHLPTIPFDVVHGRGTVRAVYDIGGVDSKVAGLEVEHGKFYKDKAPPTETSGGKLKCFYRVLRNGKVISVGGEVKATSLKHFKEDVMEVSRGKECGLSLHQHSDYAEGDVIECFSIEQKKQTV